MAQEWQDLAEVFDVTLGDDASLVGVLSAPAGQDVPTTLTVRKVLNRNGRVLSAFGFRIGILAEVRDGIDKAITDAEAFKPKRSRTSKAKGGQADADVAAFIGGLTSEQLAALKAAMGK